MKFQNTSRRQCALLFASLFIAFAIVGAPVFGQATTTTTNETIPFANTQPNSCNGDTVNFQGNLHVTNHVTTDASGGYHLRTHVNYQDVTGTGTPSGLNYRVGTTENLTTNDSDSAQFEMTVIQTVKIVSQGAPPNFFLQIVLHVTVNANGVATSEVVEVRPECRGRV